MAIKRSDLYSSLWTSCVPRLADEEEALAQRVDEHLKKMGFT
jgi:hypothetical protein